MPWSTPWAPTHAELAACVECGLCLPHCPTFRITGDETASPRGRLNAMAAVAAGTLPLDDAVAGIFEFCLQCRACEAACPSLVPFGRAMEGARAEVAAALSRSRMRRRVARSWIARPRAVALATLGAAIGQRLRADRWLPGRLRRGLRGMRRLPLRRRSLLGTTHEPTGLVRSPEVSNKAPTPNSRLQTSNSIRGTVGLLAGCVMDPWFGEVHRALVAVLTAAGYRVVVPGSQTCCGALAAHEGEAAAAQHLNAINRSAFADVDLVVVAAAGCSAHLVAHEIGVPVEDAVVTVARLIDDGSLPRVAPSGIAVAVQDPCHHRHAQRIVTAPRTIIAAAGCEPVDLDPQGMCCGAAGLYSVAHPETASRLGRDKADQAVARGVELVASANPGCELQLRSHLDRTIKVAHPVEIYAVAARFI